MQKEDFFSNILLDSSISTVFQPIVSLETGIIFGYEALSRISVPSCYINIEELFQIARRQDRLWDLEKLCLMKALQNAAAQSLDCLLFLNLDTNIIHDPKFSAGFTVEKLQEYGINADSVVIELTEQSAISDMSSFVSSVQHYQTQGLKIAIDDFGNGYSGLNRACSLSPKFLKINLDLVHEIHKDTIKQSAVGSIVDFCRQTGIQVIAEGIENEEDLKTVIQLGVDFGQGFYLGLPNSIFQDIAFDCKKQIREFFNGTRLQSRQSVFGRVGDIGKTGATALKSSPSLPLYEKLKLNPELSEFFILDELEQVCGILTRQQIFEKFGGEFGYILSQRMNVTAMMLKEVLAVDEQMPIDKVSEIAMQRSAERVYDSIAITRNGKYFNTVTVRELLLTSIQLQVQRASDANPLTGFPGNHEIQRVIETTFRLHEPWAIIYLDLDNFKAYNDAYCFANGDAMLKTLADTMRRCAGESDFLGHIGGDDFVIISHSHEVTELCKNIAQDFHSAIETLYSTSDWEQGFIVSTDRNGFSQNYGIASLSISVVTNKTQNPQTMEELSALIAQNKKESKQRQGDSIVIS
ncbi:MAG: GGDEF domain-containing protein [Vulcanibacillus sp.]